MRGKSSTCRKASLDYRWSATITGSETQRRKRIRCRQVRDLPRIGVAEPVDDEAFDSGRVILAREISAVRQIRADKLTLTE